jgi:hypothetical protein
VFLAFGGFDVRYPRPSTEDIELGGHLARAGHRVRLAKRLRGTHLKRAWCWVHHRWSGRPATSYFHR